MAQIRSSALAIAALMTAGLTACGSTPVRQTLTIGAVLPLSGAATAVAAATQNGILAAVNFVNAQGGVLGKNLAVQTSDGGSIDPGLAIIAAQDLIDKYQVTAIVGPAQGSPILLPWAATHQVVLMSPYGVYQTGPFVYSIVPGGSLGDTIMAHDVVAQGIRNLSVVGPTGQVPYVKPILQALSPGMQVSLVSYGALDDYTGWTGGPNVAASVIANQSDGAYVFNAGPTDFTAIYNSLRAQGFTGIVYMNTPTTAPPPGIGTVAATGIRQLNVFANPADSPDYLAFLQAYKAWDNGNTPGSSTGLEAEAFDATLWVALAMARAGSAAGAAINDAMPHIATATGFAAGPINFAAAVSRLAHGEDSNFHGARTRYVVDANGQLAVPEVVNVCCDASGQFKLERVYNPGDY